MVDFASAINQQTPKDGAGILRARHIQGTNACERISSWIHDYAQLQAKHAADLERFLNKHIISESELATLAQPWQSVAQYALQLTTQAEESGKRIRAECDKPIKELTKFAQLDTIAASLDTDITPETVHKFEQLDEQRLTTLKACLARFATIEVDKSQTQVKNAEYSLQAMLNNDVKDDLEAFGAQIVSGVAAKAPATALRTNEIGNAMRNRSASTSNSIQSRKTSATSTNSTATVKRRSSLLFLGKDKEKDDSGNKHGLRAKVGSIFGKKKDRSASGHSLAAASHPNLSEAARNNVTRPADFGLRQPSSMSVHSMSSQSSSIRQPRTRTGTDDDLYVPSPLRGSQQPVNRAMPPQLQNSPEKLAPSAIPPSFPGSQVKLVPSSTGDKRNAEPVPPTSGSALTGPALNGPTMQPPVSTQSTGPTMPMDAQPNAQSSPQAQNQAQSQAQPQPQPANSAPAPPPSRNSIIGPAAPRAASSSNLTQNQRQQRVASHLFVNLNPAQEANNRNSTLPEEESRDVITELNEIRERDAPNSPDQFFTPAPQFQPQFSSVTSLATNGHVEYPELPQELGLVSAIVEYVNAEFKNDEMVQGTLEGHAIATVKTNDEDPIPDQPISVGILLIDPEAKLTPCPLLKQTTALSFDLSPNTYLHPQELCSYTANAYARFPLKLIPMWRIEGTTVRLVIHYQMYDKYIGGDEVEISNLVVYVNVAGTSKAKSAMSKPVATFSREKQRVTWRLPNSIKLKRGEQAGKLLCQFSMENEGALPGTVHVSAKVNKLQNSVLQLRRLSLEGEWVEVPSSVSALVSGQRTEAQPQQAN